MDISPVVRQALDAFPGPITFVEPSGKWWLITPAALLVTAGLLFLVVHDFCLPHIGLRIVIKSVRAIAGAVFFGFVAIYGATIILSPPSLRLDQSGFTFTTLFRSRVFTWDQVSDFGTSSTRNYALVVFTAAKPYRSMLEKFDGQMGGRNSCLPDAYGFAVRDLLQLMTTWQELALRRQAADVRTESVRIGQRH